MKRLLIIALLLVAPGYAQVTSNTAKRVIGGTKPATCSAGPPADIWADTTVTPPVLNVCGPANTWNAVGTGTTINATNNAIPKRSSSTAFVDSSLSDDGTNVTATEPILVKGSGVAIAGGVADSTHPAFRVGATIGGKPSWDVLTGDNASFTPANAQAWCVSSSACMWGSGTTFLMGNTTANDFSGFVKAAGFIGNTTFLTSLYTNATTTFSNVTGLSFPVAASQNYKIRCDLDYQSSATTADVKIQWTGPASPTFLTYDLVTEVTGSTLSASVNPATATTTGAFSTSLSESGTPTINTNFPMTLTMTLINGVNAGTVQLQAAATGVGTISILPGSCVVTQ